MTDPSEKVETPQHVMAACGIKGLLYAAARACFSVHSGIRLRYGAGFVCANVSAVCPSKLILK